MLDYPYFVLLVTLPRQEHCPHKFPENVTKDITAKQKKVPKTGTFIMSHAGLEPATT